MQHNRRRTARQPALPALDADRCDEQSAPLLAELAWIGRSLQSVDRAECGRRLCRIFELAGQLFRSAGGSAGAAGPLGRRGKVTALALVVRNGKGEVVNYWALRAASTRLV
jgi:hypothetical protein